jgi:hypothetical protein
MWLIISLLWVGLGFQISFDCRLQSSANWRELDFNCPYQTNSLRLRTIMIVFLFCQGGYRGFYARNTQTLNPKVVNDIHKRGGTVLGTSRGGHDTMKIVDSIEDRDINQVREMQCCNLSEICTQSEVLWHSSTLGYEVSQSSEFFIKFFVSQVYIIGGDGTHRGADLIYQACFFSHVHMFFWWNHWQIYPPLHPHKYPIQLWMIIWNWHLGPILVEQMSVGYVV